MTDELRLTGLDGTNPLGFLTALGVAHLATRFAPRLTMRWDVTGDGWRPVVSRHGCTQAQFEERLLQTLESVREVGFNLDPALPFERLALRAAMERAALASPVERLEADLLAGQGTDAFTDETGMFEDTELRLVRSGDSTGNGLPAYVLKCRSGLTTPQVHGALFLAWRYEDDCLSLRWDPQEDQDHALRWDDPSKKANKRAGSRGVQAANALAAQALALLPVQPTGRHGHTTGFVRHGRKWHFSWPLWVQECPLDVIRSVLALADLTAPAPDSVTLRARGIAAVMRSECVAPNMYYRNFAPARPA